MICITQHVKLNTYFPFLIENHSHEFWDKLKSVPSSDDKMHIHYCLEINYVTSGNGTYIIGNKLYNINKGDIILINNFEYHAIIYSNNLDLKVIIFDPKLIWAGNNFDYHYLKFFYEKKENINHIVDCKQHLYSELCSCIFEMEKEQNEKQEGYQLIIKSVLLKTLALLYRTFEQSNDKFETDFKHQFEYNRIIDALNFINNNFSNHITLQQIASCVNMNTNYFSSYFKKVMNETVTAYINNKRISYACYLLVVSDKTILEIAIECGLENVSYFNRIFKNKTNISPGQYRKIQSQRANNKEITYSENLPNI